MPGLWNPEDARKDALRKGAVDCGQAACRGRRGPGTDALAPQRLVLAAREAPSRDLRIPRDHSTARAAAAPAYEVERLRRKPPPSQVSVGTPGEGKRRRGTR